MQVYVGTCNLSAITMFGFIDISTNYTFYVDHIALDVGQWVKVETYIPNELLGAENVNFEIQTSTESYPYTLYFDIMTNDWSSPDSGLDYYILSLNGLTYQDIYTGVSSNITFSKYTIGESNQTVIGKPNDNPPQPIVYSLNDGCLKRIGFSFKMPPDDGLDNSTYGISQVKLKTTIYYENNGEALINNNDVLGLNYIWEIWYGAELIYQGEDEPSISDFMPVDEFIPTNIIQMNMIYFSMMLMGIGTLTGLGLPFIGIATIIISFTILREFLLNAQAVTGYMISTSNQIITLIETYQDLRLFCVILLILNILGVIIGIMNKYMND